MTLNPVQQRVLGALIEKEIATPENYPLSLNALLNACNQRSSRDPVMELNEGEVREALSTLEALELTAVSRDSRVAKYEHRARTVLNLRRDETAVVCLLLLRGPQTPGEIRSRADRLYTFDDLEAVQSTVDRLASRPPGQAAETGPLVRVLPRQPGSREARYVHLLGGGGPGGTEQASPTLSNQHPGGSRPEIDGNSPDWNIGKEISRLEEEIAHLAATVEVLEKKIVRLENLQGHPSTE